MEHRIEPLAGTSLRRLAALLSIALAGLLIVGDPGAAAAPFAFAPSPGAGGQTSAMAEPEEEVEWEWGEEEEEEEEEEEVEWEWGEEGEEEIEVELEFEERAPVATKSAYRQTECALQDTSARVVTSDVGDSLHLFLRYASREPVRIEVNYSVDGARGATSLDPITLRATRHGRVDYTEHPSARRMSQIQAAHTLAVTIEVPGAPRSCRRYPTSRLTPRHSYAHTVWSEAARRPQSRR